MDYDIDKFIIGDQYEVSDLVAYSLYECVKTQYEKSLDEKQVSGKNRTTQLQGFKDGALSDKQVHSLKRQAKDMVIEVSEELARKKGWKLFWSNVLAGIIATLIFSIASSFVQYNITTRKALNEVKEILKTIEANKGTTETSPKEVPAYNPESLPSK